MLDNLESSYDCSNAGEDLHRLKQELAELRGQGSEDAEAQERINRLENQISFIMNKCDINSGNS
ncbi:DUF2524 domain-containing protein [Cohnella thailandensis]|uniref:DUF2524 domain-containing protein n=1 Tax=Cohnella thailandensis TaxID=557557 RepID=A0A841SRB1_9BACL|nr:DUF2524 domain-containing protein [Cohnella thailandensis]MBB6633146.1 DUF2524 domain-containing protein [Cohnella thailandensis]MBP1975158.1 archaellum component FlaC [Cohnella thailandensis]